MTDYVLGFLFDYDFKRVVLIEKSKPDWQKGFLNGVGGKVEDGEAGSVAMKREFLEEAGLEIPDWEYVCQLIEPDKWRVKVYRSFVPNSLIDKVQTKTEEKVGVYNVDEINKLKTINNLRWLVPLCLDSEVGTGAMFIYM